MWLFAILSLMINLTGTSPPDSSFSGIDEVDWENVSLDEVERENFQGIDEVDWENLTDEVEWEN